MKLQLFRHNWGLPAASWETKLRQIQQEGYAGIETGALQPDDYGHFRELLAEFQLQFIPQIFTCGDSVAEHATSLRQQVSAVSMFNPDLVNCHSGSDAWTNDEAMKFFGEATAIEAQAGFALAHETHRGRCFFNPWATARILEMFPTLKICADFSHWVCVCERLLTTEEDIIRQYAGRAIHIHARVGYENGPQVPDPRAPEWQQHVAIYEKWWNWIWQARHKAGADKITLTPEFGPPTYLHTIPHTNAPIANLEEICRWQADRQMRLFKEWSKSVIEK